MTSVKEKEQQEKEGKGEKHNGLQQAAGGKREPRETLGSKTLLKRSGRKLVKIKGGGKRE